MQTRQWSDQVIRKEIRKWKVRDGYASKEVQVVVTPKVREEVRKHYGCASLSGAELEDQGEEGTALTHWEKRLFEVLLPYWVFLSPLQNWLFIFEVEQGIIVLLVIFKPSAKLTLYL